MGEVQKRIEEKVKTLQPSEEVQRKWQTEEIQQQLQERIQTWQEQVQPELLAKAVQLEKKLEGLEGKQTEMHAALHMQMGEVQKRMEEKVKTLQPLEEVQRKWQTEEI